MTACSSSHRGARPASTSSSVSGTSATTSSFPSSGTGLRPDFPYDPRPGICPSQAGDTATITASAGGLPVPRCLVVWANQRLRVDNRTTTVLTATLGYHPSETARISPGSSFEFVATPRDRSRDPLPTGVYELKLSPLALADVWVAATVCTTARESCYTPPHRPPNGRLTIFDCPAQVPTTTAAGNNRADAIGAALAEVRAVRHWIGAVQVDAAYPVGRIDQGEFPDLFAFQVPLCGEAFAERSWAVELHSTTLERIGNSVAQAQDVVAPFPDGWHVWGQYH